MMDVLIIFGSKTDEAVYRRLAAALEKKAVSYELRIASAHKTPAYVEKVLKNSYKVIIAGAGLAAHLPGVVAAKTQVPVIGIPCPGAYDGLDAFLSVVQMPPGIPVLGVGVGKAEEAAENAAKMLRQPERISVVGDGRYAEKAVATLQELGVSAMLGTETVADAVNIVFVALGKKVEQRKELVVYCPVAENATAADAVKAKEMAASGLWVGLNMAENAAVAAAEIAGEDAAIAAYRKKLAEKVLKADEEVNP